MMINKYRNMVGNIEREKACYSVLEMYCGRMFEPINYFLRTNYSGNYTKEFIVKYVELIDEVMRYSILKQNLLVVRRFSKKYFDKNNKKRFINDKAFLNTSIDLFFNKEHEWGTRKYRNDILLLIKAPKGYNGILLEQLSKRNEYELLLDKNVLLEIECQKTMLNFTIVLAQAK